jgi:putative flippase GtrA
MKKSDIIYPLIIGEAIALILLGILKYAPKYLPEMPLFITKIAWYFPIVLPLLAVFGVFVASLIGRKIPALFQLAKFVLVGALNTFVDFGILILLLTIFGVTAGLLYSVSKAFSFSCSVVNSYFWNKFWTFGKKETKGAGREFGKFYLIAGIGFFLNVGIASFAVNIIGPRLGLSAEIWAMAGAFIATLCVFMWNFLGYKFIVFKK